MAHKSVLLVGIVALAAATTLSGSLMVRPHSSRQAEEPSRGPLPKVTVPLLGAMREVKGLDPPEHELDVDSADLLQPHELTIILPDQRELVINARSMSIIQLNGHIIGVYVRRPMDPVSFKEAVADLRETMKALKIEPNEQMKRQMDLWPDDAPGVVNGVIPHVFKTGTTFHPRFGELHIRMSPDPIDGWYYLMIFGVIPEAALAPAKPNATPSTKPDATNSTKETLSKTAEPPPLSDRLKKGVLKKWKMASIHFRRIKII